jgi:hypothetical protein
MVAADKATLFWQPATDALTYDVARGTISGRRFVAATCVATGLPTTTWSDAMVPARGKAFYYVVRGRNAAGAGPWGATGPMTPVCP